MVFGVSFWSLILSFVKGTAQSILFVIIIWPAYREPRYSLSAKFTRAGIKGEVLFDMFYWVRVSFSFISSQSRAELLVTCVWFGSGWFGKDFREEATREVPSA